MAPLALVANFATRWRYLHRMQIWPPDGATCNSCKFGHHIMPLALSNCLVLPRSRHLHYVPIWPPSSVSCIATLPRIGIELALFASGKAHLTEKQGMAGFV